MASESCFLLFLLLGTFSLNTIAYDLATQITRIYPPYCLVQFGSRGSSYPFKTCNAQLYQHNGLTPDEISSYYSVNKSEISPITRYHRQDYLVNVPCACRDVNGTVGYFYETNYLVQEGDIFENVSSGIYSGQAWRASGEESLFISGQNVTIHLVCGCVENEDQVIVTYTIQQWDTLPEIADLLSSNVEGIENMNTYLATNPGYLDVGWVLYVPTELKGILGEKEM